MEMKTLSGIWAYNKEQVLWKMFSMNIRSLPKHKGELVAYLSNSPLFDILVLTEIGARNMDLTAN